MNLGIKKALVASVALVGAICSAEELSKFTATCTNSTAQGIIKLISIPKSNQIKALLVAKREYSKTFTNQVYTSNSVSVTSDTISFMGFTQDERKNLFELDRKTGVLRDTYYGNSSFTLIFECSKGDDYNALANEINDYESQINTSISNKKNKQLEDERAKNNRPNKF